LLKLFACGQSEARCSGLRTHAFACCDSGDGDPAGGDGAALSVPFLPSAAQMRRIGGTEAINLEADPGQTETTTNGELFISFRRPLGISRVAFVTDPFPRGAANDGKVADFVVPEPATLGLLGLGFAARRRRKAWN